MAEYIKRSAAIEAAKHAWAKGLEPSQYIEIIPAADVAPVVRCKDCKYWQDNNDGYPHEECRWGHGETPDADDFCSYGARMDGDSDAKTD